MGAGGHGTGAVSGDGRGVGVTGGLCISINTRTIDQPQRIGLHVPPCCGIVVAHPVLMQAGFRLEPLPRKPRSRRRPGRHPHPAERQIGGGPGLDAGAVGPNTGRPMWSERIQDTRSPTSESEVREATQPETRLKLK